jgi:adenylate cyclase
MSNSITAESLLSRRDELLALAEQIVEVAGDLVEQAQHESSLEDLQKVLDAGERLRLLTDQQLSAIHTEEVIAGESADPFSRESRVRHEIGNALNHVLGYCEMLVEDAADDEADNEELLRDVRTLHDAGGQMLQIIDQVARASGRTPRRRATDVAAPHKSEKTTEAGRILVVEDNQPNRELLERRLVRQGHHVTTAADGQAALDRLAKERFDLVLLDIMMPQVDGFQVLEVLKKSAQWRDIPVIMISALDEQQSAVRCIEMGAEDYLNKPFDPVLLRARIGACLEKKRLHDRERLHLDAIEKERRRSDELLHVILPDKIVEELRATDRVEPRRYDDVAVLFADLVGFTPYCDSHDPEEVVADLQRLIERWEDVALSHGVEKIKTIGDAFMAAAGLLQPVKNPVACCVRCGEEMIAAAAELTPQWKVRVGVHVGPVVAGVLGRRQYLFDLWGDTVNTASRIEHYGVVGAVCLSGDAWQKIALEAQGESLGHVEVKGKGRIEMVQYQGEKRAVI